MSENERRKIGTLLDPTQAEALAKRLDLVDRLRAVPPSDRFGRLAAEAADALEHSWEVGRQMLDEIDRLSRLEPELAPGPSPPARAGDGKTARIRSPRSTSSSKAAFYVEASPSCDS
jgi:hypothetical protein